MMNGMKGIWLALLLLAVSFAQVTETQDFDGKLYTVRTDPSLDFLNIEPRLHFENTITASTTERVIYGGPASNLQEDAIVCAGEITMTADADGVWASNGLYEYVDYWFECDPPSYTRVSNDRPIFWDTGYYDNLFGIEICSSEESCWALNDGLVTQRVNTYQVYLDDPSSRTFDREGQTTVFCKGRKTLRADGTLVASGVMESDGGVLFGTMALPRGMHSLTNDLEVTGCLGVVRFPQCGTLPNFEKIFGRTRAERGYSAPGYTTTLQTRMNIQSVTNEDLRCSGDFVSITPDPITAEPGTSTPITITIRNNCPESDHLCEPITITGIRVSDGFTFAYDSSGMVPLSYFVVNPGQAKEFTGTLTVPDEEGVCTTVTEGLTFNVSFTCPACEPVGGTLDRSATYTVSFECPPGEQTDLVPRFEPDLSRFDIPTGEDPNITIITRNHGGVPSNPGDTCVQVGYYVTGSIGTFGPPIRLFVPLSPEYTYPYPALDPGGEYGDELDFMCTEEMENQTYVVLVDVDCPRPGTTNEGELENNNRDERYIRCVPPTGGNETGEEEHYGCTVVPGSYQGIPGETYDFTLICRDNVLGIDGECDFAEGVDWSYRATGNASVSEDGIGNLAGYWVTLDRRSKGEGNVHITADVTFPDGNATCTSDINIPLVPCEEFV